MNGMRQVSTQSDQAERLRALARRARPAATTVAILSGKGGVGKTNVAVNLSVYLAGTGLRVALVDLDLGLANADLLLNVHPRYTLAHVVGGVRALEDICVPGPAGMRLVPGASGLHALASLSGLDRDRLLAQLHNLEASTDIIVLDCAAGVSPNVIGFALAADRVIVVTTPEPTAMADAYATVKALQRERCAARVELLVNMAQSRGEAQRVFERVQSVARKFLNYPVADGGYLLHDTAVEQAVRRREPFVTRFPLSNASACVAAVAKSFVRSTSRSSHRGDGFFRRLVGLFA